MDLSFLLIPAAAWFVCFLCRNGLRLNRRPFLPVPVARDDIFFLEVSGDALDDTFRSALEDALCTRGLLHVTETAGQETVVLRVKEKTLTRTFYSASRGNGSPTPCSPRRHATGSPISSMTSTEFPIPALPAARFPSLSALLGGLFGGLLMVKEFLPQSAWVIQVSVGIERGGAAERLRRVSVSRNEPRLPRYAAMNFLRKRLAQRVSEALTVPPLP